MLPMVAEVTPSPSEGADAELARPPLGRRSPPLMAQPKPSDPDPLVEEGRLDRYLQPGVVTHTQAAVRVSVSRCVRVQ
jgi:hypothetical protein